MPDRFKELIRKLRDNDKTALLLFRKNIETICDNYLSKQYIEPQWIGSETGILNINFLYDDVLNTLITKIIQEKASLNTFLDFKEFIVVQINEKLIHLFGNFYNLLNQNNEKAWLTFNQILKYRTKCWLVKKGIHDNDTVDYLYQEAIAIFIKKMKEGELSFEDSRYLKSYIFKIINLKLYELQRALKKDQKKSDEEIELDYSDNYYQYVPDIDKNLIREKLFGRLNKLEINILTEVYYNDEKLKDIAQKLNISEANCRVIKHRALAKLANTAKQLGY